MKYNGKALSQIPTELFLKVTECNLKHYRFCKDFWWPIIEKRATFHTDNAFELLLNHPFRWGFLNNKERLQYFETQLEQLYKAFGQATFEKFRVQVTEDFENHPIENDMHNRMLSLMVEIGAMQCFLSQGYKISPLFPGDGQKQPDFRAEKDGAITAVEVKYIRYPNKLEEFLFRWIEAQREIDPASPFENLYVVPMRFEFSLSNNRSELNKDEINNLKGFLGSIYQNPSVSKEMKEGRVSIKYNPDGELLLSSIPLDVKKNTSQLLAVPLFDKIAKVLKGAKKQLDSYSEADKKTIYLGLNLTEDIKFLWLEHFEQELEKFQRDGIVIIHERYDYL